jgi:protein MBA1
MASSLRLPAGSFASSARSSIMIPQPSASHIRSFSQVPQRWAAIRSQNFNAPSMTQPSMKTRTKEAMRGQAMPNDIGLLPGTFVRPLWRDMPSVFKEPKNALRMQWTWMKSVFQNFARCVVTLRLLSPARDFGFSKTTTRKVAMAKLTSSQSGEVYEI